VILYKGRMKWTACWSAVY